METIAVILPTRNRLKMLQRTVASLRAQTMKNFVVIISDNGSKDDTRLLNESAFPDLNVRWIRRDPELPGIAEHYNALWKEVDADYVALAHDDEIYGPEWLATLRDMMDQRHPSGKPVLLAMAHEVVVDLKGETPRYYTLTNDLPAGVYNADELKRLLLFDGKAIRGNGFMVSRAGLVQAPQFDSRYEQFDFEWVLRVITDGAIAVSEKKLHTCTVHRNTTQGSATYIRHYYLNRIHSSEMYEEWLESLKELPPERRAEKRNDLIRARARCDFSTLLKGAAYAGRGECRALCKRVVENPLSSPLHRFIARAVCFPLIYPFARLSLGALASYRKKRAMGNRSDLWPMDIAEVRASFPLLLSDGFSYGDQR